jgi:CheY-like chemotaxis protein
MEKSMSMSYILLVEDNADDAFLASRIIAKVCTEKIIVARDGEEASRLLREMAEDGSYKQIRLVLLDLKLPKISGIAILQTIRSSAVLRNLPVAVLTSSDNDVDQERCRELGVLDYIYKPMTAARLQSVFWLDKDA